MRGRVMLMAAALLSSCERGAETPVGNRGSYLRPDVRSLLAQVADPGAQAGIATLVHRVASERLAEAPAEALWAAVRKAESEGLTELYGVEYFGLGEPTYVAILFVRTPTRTACLYANGELHDLRDLQRTVPAQRVVPEEFALLRDRIGVHLPLQRTASVESVGAEEEVVLLHVLRDGRSASAIWRVPDPAWAPGRQALRAHRRDYAVAGILRALWASVPLAFFDGDGIGAEDTYASLPGY